MKEIPNNEFDRIFREKVENFDYSFEEEAWKLMEGKLRRRQRYIMFRNTGTVLLLFLLIGAGYYFLQKETIDSIVIANKEKPVEEKKNLANIDPIRSEEISASGSPILSHNNVINTKIAAESKLRKPDKRNPEGKSELQTFLPVSHSITFYEGRTDETYALMISPDFTANLSGFLRIPNEIDSAHALVPEKKSRKQNSPNLSLTLSAGPDFSSLESIAGRKGKINAGLLLNVNIKKLTLSTGAKYGAKKYSAEVYDYQLSNPARASMISGIDASCNILEVPFQVSYAVENSEKRKIEISTSLSSYFMLEERYLFKYTPESGIGNFLLEKKNENNHLFSVVGLSANYSFKPINKNLQLGIEPYVKLPLAGVGEGKVRLKSSGIALNLTYDLSKGL